MHLQERDPRGCGAVGVDAAVVHSRVRGVRRHVRHRFVRNDVRCASGHVNECAAQRIDLTLLWLRRWCDHQSDSSRAQPPVVLEAQSVRCHVCYVW